MADNSTPSRSWFATFNNPEEHGYSGTPEEIVHRIVDEYVGDSLTRVCACSYCISADGLKHLHIVYEDNKVMRFSAIKNLVPYGVHLEPTRGSKEQAEAYIKKTGKYSEKGEQVLYTFQSGEIKASKGKSKVLENIDNLISLGKTPSEILSLGGANYYKERETINKMYLDKVSRDVPYCKDMVTYYHVGESGSGKSYISVLLKEKYGDDKVFLVSDYSKGFLDEYFGEPIIIFDDIKRQLSYSDLLRLFDKYKVPIHCRYFNKYSLWTEAHLTSVFPPDVLYKNLVDSYDEYDSFKQLKRRFTYIVYHWQDDNGFHSFELPMEKYTCYEALKALACGKDGFYSLNASEMNQVPFRS